MSGRQIGRRAIQSLVVLIGLSFISFLLIHLVPGDPVRIALGPKAPQQQVIALRQQLGLDHSLVRQYLDYVWNVLHGDLGYSLQDHVAVSTLVRPRDRSQPLPARLRDPDLGRGRAAARDHLGLAAQPGVRPVDPARRAWSPSRCRHSGSGSCSCRCSRCTSTSSPSRATAGASSGALRDLTLPAFTIGLYLAPMLVRTLRSSMIDVLASDYIEAARARGLSATRVIGRHALRNAAVATVTVLAVNLGFLISGTVIVEVVFSIPGLGSLVVSQVQTRDFPTIQALTLIFGSIVILINFATDVIYAARGSARLRTRGRSDADPARASRSRCRQPACAARSSSSAGGLARASTWGAGSWRCTCSPRCSHPGSRPITRPSRTC